MVYFLVATLDYLAKGGRIGGAAVLLGGLLQIKPILVFQDGIVDQFEKARTYQRAFNRLVDLAVSQAPKNSHSYLSVMHAGVPDQAEAMAKAINQYFQLPEIPILDVPPAIVTHGGPGILGVAFFRTATV